jgi:sRNA-binding carbon storage regulator CsrA
MLILTRRVGQSFIITPHPMLKPSTPVGELFCAGPLSITVGQIGGARVKFSVAADPQLLILREELYRPESSLIATRRTGGS